MKSDGRTVLKIVKVPMPSDKNMNPFYEGHTENWKVWSQLHKEYGDDLKVEQGGDLTNQKWVYVYYLED